MSAVADKLREARALIERGWCQGNYSQSEDNSTSYCAEGALAMVDGMHDAEHALREAVGKYNIIGWNDAPTRTKAEILAAFDKAIALAEQSL